MGDAVDLRESAGQHDLAVRLQGERGDLAVRGRLEGRVRAVVALRVRGGDREKKDGCEEPVGKKLCLHISF